MYDRWAFHFERKIDPAKAFAIDVIVANVDPADENDRIIDEQELAMVSSQSTDQ